jgi:hypothetical protein
MGQSARCEQPLRELMDADLPADELERLARVDALLREAAALDQEEAATLSPRARFRDWRATTGRSCTKVNSPARPTRDSRDCGYVRASISAALDGELSDLTSIRARDHVGHCPSCAAFRANAERLATVLRSAPPEPAGRPLATPPERRPSLRLASPPTTNRSTAPGRDDQTHVLKLTFGQLALVYKSLQAVKTLDTLPPQAELLNDTIQLVDLAMTEAV